MTSAKDWAQELSDIEQSCGMNQLHENEAFIQNIQLDAIKEGMNRAANLARAFSSLEVNIPEQLEIEANNLTLKDL